MQNQAAGMKPRRLIMGMEGTEMTSFPQQNEWLIWQLITVLSVYIQIPGPRRNEENCSTPSRIFA